MSEIAKSVMSKIKSNISKVIVGHDEEIEFKFSLSENNYYNREVQLIIEEII